MALRLPGIGVCPSSMGIFPGDARALHRPATITGVVRWIAAFLLWVHSRQKNDFKDFNVLVVHLPWQGLAHYCYKEYWSRWVGKV